MTEPSEAARQLARRLEPRVNALARSMAESWAAQLPEYRPSAALETAASAGAPVSDEAAATARRAIRCFLRHLSGSPSDEQARAFVRERAVQRADEGIALHALVRAYMIGTRVLYAALCDEAVEPDEVAALPEVALLLFAAQDAVVSDVVRAYQDESAAIGSNGLERRRALVRDLVLGGAPPAAALVDEFGLGAGATVLALRFGLAPESGAVPRPNTASKSNTAAKSNTTSKSNTAPLLPLDEPTLARRLHRVESALDRHFEVQVPSFLDASGGYALVPGSVAVAPLLPGLLAEAWRDEVRIGVARTAEPERIPAAARVAGEILRLAVALGRPAGVYLLDDVLLEYHLSRSDESSAALAALLDPLAERPELLVTVRVFLDEQHDRRRTARRLSLHPNTVDNRLARVAQLTGLDPSTPRGVTLLVTALALRDLG